LIVLFFQRHTLGSRIVGTMRMLLETREFVSALPEEDHVAVVFFQSHLELVQDFTRDRKLLLGILEDRIVPYVPPVRQTPGPYPSMASYFDVQAGRNAATPEHGLRVTAEALQNLPGSKSMLFLGWGIGIMSGGAVRMRPEYESARRALADAQVTVFSLDVTQANYHSLEGPLIRMANDTGGMYRSTYINTNVAMDAVVKALEGHYLLTFSRPDLPSGRHRMKIRLNDQPGFTYHRVYYND
jgi:VWFA-related protein